MANTKALISWPVDVAFRPERLVSVDTADEGRGVGWAVIEGTRLTALYSVNLVMYAAPLTLAGYGVVEATHAPEAVAPLLESLVGDAGSAWQLLVSLGFNGAFLLVGTLLTFGTFHVGILLSGASSGVLQSLRAVTYSTGIYLAVMYTLVWYVAMSPAMAVAEKILLTLQGQFFYYFIDMFNSTLELPGGRPDAVDATGLSGPEQFVLILLFLSATYFLYVLYVGARVGHNANRIQALIATGIVLVSPALYVIGTILFSLYT